MSQGNYSNPYDRQDSYGQYGGNPYASEGGYGANPYGGQVHQLAYPLSISQLLIRSHRR